MNNFLTLTLLFSLSIASLFAQTEEDKLNKTHHTKSHEKEANIEIITSGIYSYNLRHKESAFSNEIHVTYWFNNHWGTGLSYTLKYEKKLAHDIALIGSWNPTKWMTINAGPNFAIPNKERAFETSAYLEAEFNIRVVEWFHFGPVVGSLIGKNSELTTGIQFGFEF